VPLAWSKVLALICNHANSLKKNSPEGMRLDCSRNEIKS
jgi:hypothetical protein